jgi:hypothetical protein
LGGFNWSSQHLTSEVVSDGNIGAATGDMGGAREVGLTGPAAGRAA